jgi:hypothetical protein
MPPARHLASAALLLLALAVLGRDCREMSPGEGILFACESDGSCAQAGHVCGVDGFCRLSAAARRTSNGKMALATHEEAAAPGAASGGGREAGAAPAPEPTPENESAADRCARRCAERQEDCTARCGEGPRCRQHCGRSTDACYARCQQAHDAREATRQRREDSYCLGEGGRPRTCTQAEEQALREAMKQAAEFLCQDGRGEHVPCPEHLQQLEKSRRFVSKD